MKKTATFSSTIWRFGPIFFPQYITVTKNGFEYTKYKLKNYIGVPVDIVYLDRNKINSVTICSHLLKGSEVFIEQFSGNYIHLKNFRRKDAELIQEVAKIPTV